MKPTTLLIGFFAALLFAGCAQTRQTVSDSSLSRVYDSSSERLFETTLAALQSHGFAVSLADKSRGIIQTEKVSADKQTALALFDDAYAARACNAFSLRFAVSSISHDKSRLSVSLLCDENSNGILEQTLLNDVAVRLGETDATEPSPIDVSAKPMVSVSLRDHSVVKGYLLDDTQPAYLRLKLTSGGIMHIERRDIERFALSTEQSSRKN